MAVKKSNHVFRGHKAMLGGKYVTYGELELPVRYDIFAHSKDGFDWGHTGADSKQLAFSILYQLMGKDFAEEKFDQFTNDVVKTLNARDWLLESSAVISWIEENSEHKIKKIETKQNFLPRKQLLKEPEAPVKKKTKEKINVVKDVCTQLNITQKNLASILEVPEGTVSSWAVKNEIPRLGKKAIEFYIINHKNQQIIDTYKNFAKLLGNA